MADFKWIDSGLEKWLRNCVFLEDTNARVGIVGNAGARPAGSGGLSVAEVALYNEFGTIHAPARSFIRSALRTPRAKELVIMLAKACIKFSRNIDQELHVAGEGLAQVMRDKITEGETRSDKAATIKRKGYDHPLFETGTLRDSVGYELVRHGGTVIEGLGGGDEGENEGGGEGGA